MKLMDYKNKDSLKRIAIRGWGIFLLTILTTSVSAETQISLYAGLNENFRSSVDLDKDAFYDFRNVNWQGKSFEIPPYWGLRGTYWLCDYPSLGFAIDYTHAKAYANLNFRTDPSYNHLEFTDGNNLLIFNALYRFESIWNNAFIPYLGFGVGVAVPHVEVELKDFVEETYQYQLAGPAAQGLAGLEYRFNNSWSAFAEVKLSYSYIAAHLNDGGHLTTYLWEPQLALGLSYRFGN
jgi:lipid A oxidase